MMAKRRAILSRQSLFPSAVNPRAAILIIALWALCALSGLAVILGYNVRQKLTLVGRLDDRIKLRFLAEAGIKQGILELKRSPPQADTLAKEIMFGRGVVRYRLIDENGKVDINKADNAVLERLLKKAVRLEEIEAQEIAASIVDWRDEDNKLSIPVGSAEDSYYASLQYPYEAKDAAFETLEELLLVKGVTREIFDKLKGFITIYGGAGVNINSASGFALQALGLDPDTVDKILAFRDGEDKVNGTSDDNIFDSPSSIIPKLSQVYHLGDSTIAEISRISERSLITNSGNFTVDCSARLNEKRSFGVTSVASHSGKVLYWRER